MWAIPEGYLFFVDEPMVEVTAPIIEAQLVETVVLNRTHFQDVHPDLDLAVL